MSVEHHVCVVIVCDGCNQPYKGYEDEYTVHFDSAEEFAKNMAEDYQDEETAWETDGDKHYCPDCRCERAGHPLGEAIGNTRWCWCNKRKAAAVSG